MRDEVTSREGDAKQYYMSTRSTLNGLSSVGRSEVTLDAQPALCYICIFENF